MRNEDKVLKLSPAASLIGWPRHWMIASHEIIIGASNDKRKAWSSALKTLLHLRSVQSRTIK